MSTMTTRIHLPPTSSYLLLPKVLVLYVQSVHLTTPTTATKLQKRVHSIMPLLSTLTDVNRSLLPLLSPSPSKCTTPWKRTISSWCGLTQPAAPVMPPPCLKS
ncbi:hypothetical protein SMMN14_01545, partial [Sphaerulina musiva]